MEFEDYLCERGDELDNAAQTLINTVAGMDIEWDIGFIRDVIETVEEGLRFRKIPYCDPYNEINEEGELDVPCVNGDDCDNPNCPFINMQREETEAQRVAIYVEGGVVQCVFADGKKVNVEYSTMTT